MHIWIKGIWRWDLSHYLWCSTKHSAVGPMAFLHRSAHDNPRCWESRRLGYDGSREAMKELMTYNSAPPVPSSGRAPPARPATGVAGVLVHGSEQPEVPSRGRRVCPSAPVSEMNALMHQVPLTSESRRRQHPAASGGTMADLLYQGEEDSATASAADPFAHCRGGRKPATRPPPQATRGLEEVYNELMEAVRTAPREQDGSLSEYSPLLRLLQSRGVELSTDAAGTLIATCDVRGGIEYEGFLACLRMGDGAPAAADGVQQLFAVPPSDAPAPAPPPRVAPAPAPAPAPQRILSAAEQAAHAASWQQQTWRHLSLLPPQAPPPPPGTSAEEMRRQVITARAGGNLADLLNGGTSRHARSSLQDRLR